VSDLITVSLRLTTITGCVMRASKAEIYGSDEFETRSYSSSPGEGTDLTSSRLQSELYCELNSTNQADMSSVCGVPVLATLLFPIQPEYLHRPGTDSRQHLPPEQRTCRGRLESDWLTSSTMHCDGTTCGSG